MGLFGSGGKVPCTTCRGTGILSGDVWDHGCTRCGGSGSTGNSVDAMVGRSKNNLKRGSGMMKVPDIAEHERQQAIEAKLRRDRRKQEKNQPERGS